MTLITLNKIFIPKARGLNYLKRIFFLYNIVTLHLVQFFMCTAFSKRIKNPFMNTKKRERERVCVRKGEGEKKNKKISVFYSPQKLNIYFFSFREKEPSLTKIVASWHVRKKRKKENFSGRECFL